MTKEQTIAELLSSLYFARGDEKQEAELQEQLDEIEGPVCPDSLCQEVENLQHHTSLAWAYLDNPRVHSLR